MTCIRPRLVIITNTDTETCKWPNDQNTDKNMSEVFPIVVLLHQGSALGHPVVVVAAHVLREMIRKEA